MAQGARSRRIRRLTHKQGTADLAYGWLGGRGWTVSGCPPTHPLRPSVATHEGCDVSYTNSAQQVNLQTPLPLSPETVRSTGERWFEEIRPDFVQGNIGFTARAKKLIDAKRALKKRDGSFTRLVERAGDP
jgi:hypothetical protein